MTTTTVISVINLKGGTSKTTTTAFVLHALHEQGHRVYAIDADPQASLMDWHQLSRFPFPVSGLASHTIHRDIDGIVGDRFDVVGIDTPPWGTQTEAANAPIALSAARAASHILIPVAPTPAEYRRLAAVRVMLDDAAKMRPDDLPPPEVAVLLTRTVAQAVSSEVWRDTMVADGWRVLHPEVRRLERYSQALGEPVERADASAYGDAVRELLGATA